MPAFDPMTYRTNEMTFDLPQGLKDKSLNVFALTDEGPSEFSFVISRVPIHQDQTLADYTSLLIAEMQTKMPSFALLNRSERKVAGEPATYLEFVWKAEDGMMHQRQVIFAPPGRDIALLFTGTCPGRFTSTHAEAFEAAVDSVKLEK